MNLLIWCKSAEPTNKLGQHMLRSVSSAVKMFRSARLNYEKAEKPFRLLFFFFHQSVYTSKSWNNLVNFTYLNGFKKGLQLILTYQTSDTQRQRKNNVRGVTGGDEPTSWICKSSRLYSSFSSTCHFASWCHTKRANIGLKGTVHPKTWNSSHYLLIAWLTGNLKFPMF